MKRPINWGIIFGVCICIVFWFIIGGLIFFGCQGCAWQGQKHITRDPVSGIITLDAEWWSMRFLTWSKGVELYDKTDFWEAGAKIVESRSDSKAIKATGEAVGTAGGALLKEIVK